MRGWYVHGSRSLAFWILSAGATVESTEHFESRQAASAQAVGSESGKPKYTTERSSDAGRYRLAVRSRRLPIPLREFHEWTVHVESPEGAAAMLDVVQVDGGMPEHGHPFSSQPVVTRYLGQGDYLIEGVTFNMSGRWQLAFRVSGASGPDSITFDLDIQDSPRKGILDDSKARLLSSLTLDGLPPVPPDSSNRVSQDPRARDLGRELFFDAGLSTNGRIACASCHVPEKFYSDGRTLSRGLGDTARHAPSLLGAGYGSWFYWDGRRDSLWAQALNPLESLEEMGSTRLEVARYVLEHAAYGPIYEAIFGDRPDLSRRAISAPRAGPFAEEEVKAAWEAMAQSSQHAVNKVFANVGKSIAAFERSLVPSESKFDRYVASLLEKGVGEAARMLSADELSGLELFIDDRRTQCLRCHNGPLFTNHGFHNVGTGAFEGARLDFGRMVGMQAALVDPFNCDGPYSDAAKEDCRNLRFLQRGGHAAAEMNGAFKVPTLRNVAQTAPYMHDGRHRTLDEVLQHYREPPDPSRVRHELARTELSDMEIKQLIAFLSTLTGE